MIKTIKTATSQRRPQGRKAEPSARGRARDMKGAPQASLPSDGQRRRGSKTPSKEGALHQQRVPVIGLDRQPLMPTTPARARKWIKSGRATPFWNMGVFCVRMNEETGKIKQEVVLGIDPGSKREGFTVAAPHSVFLNIQAETVDWVKKKVEVRRNMRKSRRKKTPYRKMRINRKGRELAPSTKARWAWKLRIADKLSKVYPITIFSVEDIKAKTIKNGGRWNTIFSPLQTGKTWFYAELIKRGRLEKITGYETSIYRENLGLKKTDKKLSRSFDAHCVDSYVLAWRETGCPLDNKEVLHIAPIKLHRRQLHVFQPTKGGIRKNYGSTRSLGFKRGSLVKHPKYGKCYVGGNSKGKITLHTMNGQRLARNVKLRDVRFLSYNIFKQTIKIK